MEEYIYEISATEQTTPSAAIQETKTMLYLMGYINDSNEIDAFLIDVFNDVTAIDENDEKLWDAQSKGEKQSSPNEIGKNLVTLYKNYISKINFDKRMPREMYKTDFESEDRVMNLIKSDKRGKKI